MKLKYEARASSIIYNYLRSNKKNGTWLVPVNCCYYVPAVILKSKNDVEFIDVNMKDFGMDLKHVKNQLLQKKNIVGIIYVRPFGKPTNLKNEFRDFKEISPELKIIDDNCLGIPDLSSKINEFTDIEIFSTGYSKYVDLGYGGFCKLNNKVDYKSYCIEFNKQDEVYFESYFKRKIASVFSNLKLAEIINSHWLISKNIMPKNYFDLVKEKTKLVQQHKKKINEIYSSILPKEIQLNPSLNHWRFNVLVKNGNEILKNINQKNLFISNHYYPLNKLFNKQGKYKWERLQPNFLNLFNDLRYNEKMAIETAKTIKSIAKY